MGPRQLPRLHAAVREAAAVLGLSRPPQLYIKQDPTLNAFTLAVAWKRPMVVLHSALLDVLDDDEIKARASPLLAGTMPLQRQSTCSPSRC